MLRNYDGVLKTDGGIGDKAAYDPRSWGKAAEASMANRVADACEMLGSSSRTIVAGVVAEQDPRS
jgi:fructose-bisphosphate aldolase class II